MGDGKFKKISFKDIGIGKLVLLFVAGLILILCSFPGLFSSKSNNTNTTTGLTNNSSDKNENNSETKEYTEQLENRLKQILSKVNNIGNVEVMITLKSSKESVVLKDQPTENQTTKEQDSAGGTRESTSTKQQDETVLISPSSGESIPYTIKEIEPEIEGVLVIAQGGGNATVASDVVDAVTVLFNVPAHKIKVMKMNE